MNSVSQKLNTDMNGFTSHIRLSDEHIAISIYFFLHYYSLINMKNSRDYKTFFMPNSAKHEILNAPKYKNIKKFSIFQAQISLESFFFLNNCWHVMSLPVTLYYTNVWGGP